MAINVMKWIIRMLPFGYIIAIWLQSSLFNPESIETTPGLGNILEMGHLIIFAILYLFIYLAWMTYGEVTTKKEAAILIVTFFCALGDEIHQYYVPFRSASLVDILKDVVGILVTWYVIRFILKGRVKSNKNLGC